MRPLKIWTLFQNKGKLEIKINSIAIEIQQQYFFSLNSMAPQVVMLIEAGQDTCNQSVKEKEDNTKKITL